MNNTNSTFTAAVVQHPPVFLNIDESMGKAENLIIEAASNGARIIAFPETWLTGYPVWLDYSPGAAIWNHPPAKELFRILFENSIRIGDDHFTRLKDLANETGTYIIMGAHEVLGGSLYNTSFTFEPENRGFNLHRKLTPTYHERLIWGRGDGSTLEVMASPYGNIGSLICWEHWMPAARIAMHSQFETVHVAQWPSVKDLHQVASRHYAFEGQCFVLAAGTVITKKDIMDGFYSLGIKDSRAVELLNDLKYKDEDFIYNGGSAIIAPDGSYVTAPVFDEPAIIYGRINTELITEARLAIDTQGHYSRPDVFRLEIDTKPQLNVNWKV